MNRLPTWTAAILSLAVSALPVAAQSSDWNYEATIYLFMPETKTSLDSPNGNIDATLSFSDALSKLDLAFMGALAASNGRWSLLTDYNYTKLSIDNDLSGPAFSGVETSLKTQFLSGYVGYRVYEDPTLKLDLAGGFRWFNTETEFTLSPGALPGTTSTVDASWTDPVIGLRARYAISDRWSGTAFLDYGGFRSGSETWQILLTADYAINDRWMIRGGYRHISFDHEVNGNDFDFSQSGLLIGATYAFN